MASEVEIRAKLTLDNKAAAEIGKVKDGFKGAAEEAKKAEAAGSGFLKQIAATAIGANIGGVVKSIGGMAYGWLKSAAAAQDANRSMAATFAVARGISFEAASKEAGALKRSMQEMASDVGVSSKDVSAGLQVMLETMGAGEQQAGKIGDQMRNLAVVAKVMGRPVEDVAREFSFMNEGIVRAKGQFALMLDKTGIFGDNLKKGVAEFAKLEPEARAAKLEKGLSMLAGKMKDFPKTTSDIAVSYENMLGMMKGTFAGPIIKALTPVIQELAEQLKAARPEIIKMTEGLGKGLGEMAKGLAQSLVGGFKWAAANAKEILGTFKAVKESVGGVFGIMKDAIMYLVTNKEVLLAVAAGFAAIKGIGAVKGLGGMAGVPGAGGVKGAPPGAMQKAGLIVEAGVLLGTAILAAKEPVIKSLNSFSTTIGKETKTNYERLQDAGRALKDKDPLKALDLIEDIQKFQSGGQFGLGGKMDKIRAAAVQMEGEFQNVESMITHASTIVDASGQRVARSELDIGALVQAWNDASAIGNTQLQTMAASVLLGSQTARDTLVASGLEITGGIESMDQLVKQSMAQFQADMAQIGVTMGGFKFGGDPTSGSRIARTTKETTKAKAPGGGGGTTINVNKMEIKQEFRDQDPDRIAVVFQRDLLKHATRRVQSRRATIFGV